MSKILSFIDLIRGVGGVHKGVAERVPGAAKVPIKERREVTAKGSPQDIVDFYNRQGLFGKTASGEPVGASLREFGLPPGQGDFSTRGYLPEDFLLRVRDPNDRKLGSISASKGLLTPDYPGTRAVLEKQGLPSSGFPETYHFDSQDAPPGAGQAAYQLMYDLMAGTGNLNQAEILTEINQLRRPSNVMNFGLGQGSYKGVTPFAERDVGIPDVPAWSYLLTGRDRPRRRLEEMLKDAPGLADELMTLTPKQIADLNLTTDDVTGLLALHEAQAVRAFGPDVWRLMYEPGSKVGAPRPHETDFFEQLAKDHRSLVERGPGIHSAEGAIGARTLGRAATTEDALLRLMRGQKVDDIVDQITNYGRFNDAFKGRYAKGGLATALT